jgi:hypothetical protein
MSSHPVFRGVRITRSLVLCVVFCRSLFVRLSFFFSPLCCLSLFDLQILITHLVSANSSICHNSQNAAHSFSKCNISITTVIHDRFKYICKNWKQNVILWWSHSLRLDIFSITYLNCLPLKRVAVWTHKTSLTPPLFTKSGLWTVMYYQYNQCVTWFDFDFFYDCFYWILELFWQSGIFLFSFYFMRRQQTNALKKTIGWLVHHHVSYHIMYKVH